MYPGIVKKRTSNGSYVDVTPGVITDIDDALSTISTSPVQNKLITARIGTDALTTTAQNLSGAVNEQEADIAAIQEMLGNYNNAGFHNSIFRGKSLGSSITAEQWSAIGAGTFDDLFIGDYWTINSVNWRIAAFDYWYRCGDTECTTHHAVIVPDSNLASCKMNDTNITTGAYIGSDYYTGSNSNTGRATANTAITNAFGAAHILSHRELLPNAMSNGSASSWSWYDSTFELMNETMVYGTKVFANSGYEVGIDKSQLPLFQLDISKACIRASWWLRDASSSTDFARVYYVGLANTDSASNSFGVRPAFGIKA